jgi:hypothetical protein
VGNRGYGGTMTFIITLDAKELYASRDEILNGLDRIMETLYEFEADDTPYYEYIINKAIEIVRNNE